MRPGLSIAPAVQAIVVNCVSVVDPQLASIIRDDAKMVMACLEDSHAARPAHGKVIASTETRPLTTSIAVVYHVSPPSHVWLAPIQILAPATLAKVEGIFHEETMAIRGFIFDRASSTCPDNSPSVCCIGSFVPEQHAGVTPTLKHLESHKTPSTTKTPGGLPVAPTMQAIVVNCVSIVDPQLTSIVRVNAEAVIASLEDSQAACPTNGEVISPSESGPSATCVFIIDVVLPTSHVRSAIVQVLAPPALTKVEDILPEETSAISDANSMLLAFCTRDNPSVSSIGTMVPEENPSMTTTLKHLNSHKMPPCANVPFDVTSAPSVQAIVVNCVSIVKPQLASVIRNNLEVVMA